MNYGRPLLLGSFGSPHLGPVKTLRHKLTRGGEMGEVTQDPRKDLRAIP